ncbi:UNVERIFIED_ORG: hypothetical protein B2H93_04305 [Clostridium botulinum]
MRNKNKDKFKAMNKEEAIKILNESTNIELKEVEDLMSPYFIDYSMDVIQNRALPDIRDGLKPVHRRIMYALYSLGISHNKPYKKCARVVGEVIGKYNPHGDVSAYESLVKMAQSFYMRYPLIDGHGNFGSSSGDGAAAQRYTECRMEKLGDEITRGLNENVVEFQPNFDGEEIEPVVLPCRYPNLLCNGTYGIATFTSNIPSHNIGQVIDETIYQIDNPDCTIEQLVEILQAPDYPTGATIVNKKDLISLYKNGKGSLTIRSKYNIEDNKIVFTELPTGSMKEDIYRNVIKSFKGYTTKKVIDGKTKTIFIQPSIPQINNIIDESDGEDTRLIIEVKNSKDTNKVLKLLFKNKDIGLQISEGYHFTFLKGIELYEEQDLKTMNKLYIEHQQEVIKRRTEYILSNYKTDEELYNGYKIVLSNIDTAVEIIKTSKNKLEAKNKLIEHYNINENQAMAVLKLNLSSLTGMEIDNILNKLGEIEKKIEYSKLILNDKNKLNEVIKTELNEIKDKYSDDRRTDVLEYDNLKNITDEDLVEDFTTTLVLTEQQYFKKTKKYSENQKLKDEDKIVTMIQDSNKNKVMFLSDKGNMYLNNLYELDENTPSSLGQYLPNLLPLDKDETIIGMVSSNDYKGYVLIVYEDGHAVKIPLLSYKTKTNRSKLSNCLADIKPILITQITDDIDIEFTDSFDKVKIINTKDIPIKTSRSSQGKTMWSCKKQGFKVVSAKTIIPEN